MNANLFTTTSLIVLQLCLTGILTAQEKGDRIVVSADVDTKISSKVIDRVFAGHIDTITETNGKWCAISRSKGWLPKQYVMDLEMAEETYTKRIKKNQNDFDALATRGMIHFERDDYNKALQDLQASVRVAPKIPVTYNNIGIVLKEMGRLPEALGHFDHSIKLKEDYADAHENRGLALGAMGQYEKAVESFNKAISLRKSNNPWSYINRGTAKSNAGNYASAKKDFLAALKGNKNLSDAYIGLSIVYLAESDYKKALQFASQAIKKNPKNGLAFNQRGWTYYKLGNLDEAIFDFDKAIRFAPKLPIVFNNRGICYSDQGDYESAIRDFNRSLALNPQNAVAFTNRGTTHLATKKYKQAEADLKKAVEMAPTLSDASNALAWFQATCPEDGYRDGKSAVANAEKACELSNWREWSYIDTLAAAYAEVGEFDKAVEMANKAIKIAPKEELDECKTRLAKFEAKEPFRSDFGKAASNRS